MTALSPAQIPVIVGVGEISDRLADGHEGFEPRDLLAAAINRADADAGGGWLPLVDTLAIVNILSWPYADICASLTAALGIAPARTEELPAGGNVALRAIHDAANRIATGAGETTLVCGAEAFHAIAMAKKQGRELHWTKPDSGHWIKTMVDVVGPEMLRYGFDGAPSVYALYENAMRAARGQSLAEAQGETGAMWSAMSQVAAGIKEAWLRSPRTAEEIAKPSADNRPIAFPYTKLMIANNAVNQGSAVIVTSLAKARQAGVAQERIAYVWGGASARDRRNFLERDRYDHSPSIAAVLSATLAQSGLTAGDFDAVEFYSCFPCVPKLAQRAIGIDASIVPTVTGGLTYFGGPGNDYMTHAVINMVRALRSGKRLGLLLGNGDIVTKHHTMILGASPPPAGTFPVDYDVQADAEARRGPVPAVIARHDGPARLETYTVKYQRDGQPEYGLVVCRAQTGERFVARVPGSDTRTISALIGGEGPWREPVGRSGTAIAHGADDFCEWRMD